MAVIMAPRKADEGGHFYKPIYQLGGIPTWSASGISLFLLQGAPSQLIFYDRKDESGPKFSDYHITQITDSEGLQVRLFKYWFVVGYL